MKCEGRVLRRSDELKSCRGSDGSTVQVVSRMRGGAKHKDKKSKAEKKQVMGQRPVCNKGPAILESEIDRVIQSIEEDERSEGNDIEVEQKMRDWKTKLQKRPRADKGRKDMTECAMRWAVEARRKGRGAEKEQERRRQEEEEQRLQEEEEQRRQEEEEQRRQEEEEQRREEEQDQTTGQEHGKKVRFGEEEQSEVTSRFAEVRTG